MVYVFFCSFAFERQFYDILPLDAVAVPLEADNAEGIRVKELAIHSLGVLCSEMKLSKELGQLIRESRKYLHLFSKAKAAKIVRELVDRFLDISGTSEYDVTLCKECIEWARDEKRNFLRQALEARLMYVYVEMDACTEALSLGGDLLKELKKVDDKALLVEVQLLESRAFQKIGNVTKSRASLTAAKTTANGIYCPPKLQASLDLQSGILHAEEKDFKTAFSYFYEAFEGYDSINHPQAVASLKYMLLCKIMLNSPEEIQSIISGKLAMRYAGPQVDAMLSIGKASQNRSVHEFDKVVMEYKGDVEGDPIIKSHIAALKDKLLEQNLCRIIEPYSRVEVAHIARLINLPLSDVERKLSKMILDKQFYGILDQGQGLLIVFEEGKEDVAYKEALGTITGMGHVVDNLYSRVKQIN
jgi:26S proteasome regulatory subunit N6